MPAFLPLNQSSFLRLSHRNDDSESRFQWILFVLGCITAFFALALLTQSRSARPITTKRAKGRRGSVSTNPLLPTPAPKAEVRPATPTLPNKTITHSADLRAAVSNDDESQNTESQYSEANPLHLNTATTEQLELLPGVGPAMAEKILAVREEKGGFQSVDELGEVPGIGEKTMSRLQPLITVSE